MRGDGEYVVETCPLSCRCGMALSLSLSHGVGGDVFRAGRDSFAACISLRHRRKETKKERRESLRESREDEGTWVCVGVRLSGEVNNFACLKPHVPLAEGVRGRNHASGS